MAVTEQVRGPRVWHRDDFPEVFGFRDVAACLGVESSNLQHIRDLPEPVADPSNGRVWLAQEIREFAAAYDRRKRRPALETSLK